ncbi:flavin-containing monooxygenase [Nocardia huaxiensis]|uniref:NAD(P)/FAD-dependent oxidoreductase n=1 Tax=Nocardia huaxiensis TaxID=2755382 RepID=A0A7D6V723_9NOCA|nr:NAD(P)/FAD-dependent oxidoreductase [Nocardia huaxiensis]QLY29141.1 NAD(P)/FAD-dependent oxidoreductase [Nocardia huaxiensis]UFS97366.1 NAD(P)/FAD-dependent oxidoreductase [Nocardia huaxiensis]
MAPQYDAIVVGAGFGGMGAGIELDRLGLSNFLILEREDDLGGTWHVNHYPGLAVDIASVTYSYSFEPNPHWSRLFAPGAELKKYAEHVADKYDLRRRMRFNTVVGGARWDEEHQQWSVAIENGESLTARYIFTATGFLSQPYTPPFPGIETFQGKIIHSTAWDDSYDLTGRKAALIGTGATGVQLAPELAAKVSELTVFQRTPIWVVPKIDFEIPERLQGLFQRVPLTQKAARMVNTTLLEGLMVIGVLHFKEAKPLNKAAGVLAKAHMFSQLRDKKTRKAMTPDYDFGCKRPTFSNKYFKIFNEPHVRLETNSIDHIEPDGIVTADGHKTEIDTLVLATGFNLWDVNFPAIEIIGRDGVNLGKFWRDNRFQAYEGITVPKFPNFLSLNSPYSYSGLSYFTTIEAQMKHIGRLFTEMFRRGEQVFEVTEEANKKFLDTVTEKLGSSVFYDGQCSTARSYYYNQHGEAALLRPNSTLTTHRHAVSFPLDDYSYGPVPA